MLDLQTLGYSALVAAVVAAAAIFGPALLSLMSRWRDTRAAVSQSANRSVDQSAATGLGVQTRSPAPSGLEQLDEGDLPDMDAEHTTFETPRISRYLTDDEFIVFLASQKLRNGKYRLSANDIVKTVKGDRTEVLAIVRQVREAAPAEFKPLSPEQQQVRSELGLGER